MAELLNCPNCGTAIELSLLLRERISSELRESMRADTERRVADAAAHARATALAETESIERELEAARKQLVETSKREADVYRRERELSLREETASLELEQRVQIELGEFK